MSIPLCLAHGETLNPTFIRELCIALAHRWEPERLFVIFTAYIDESDSHGQAAALTMSAMLGSARQWDRMERRLRALQRNYGFTLLHATDFKRRRGEFSGWTVARASELVHDVAAAMDAELTEAATITMPRAHYQEQYRGTPFPKKMQPDSHWGLCFRILLNHLVYRRIPLLGEHRLNVVVENGHMNVGAAATVFRDVKENAAALGADCLGTVTLALKDECPPLMLADFQAHAFKLSDDRVRAGLPGYHEMVDAQSPRSGPQKIATIWAEAENFQAIKDEFAAKRKAREDDYLKRRAVWQASRGER